MGTAPAGLALLPRRRRGAEQHTEPPVPHYRDAPRVHPPPPPSPALTTHGAPRSAAALPLRAGAAPPPPSPVRPPPPAPRGGRSAHARRPPRHWPAPLAPPPAPPLSPGTWQAERRPGGSAREAADKGLLPPGGRGEGFPFPCPALPPMEVGGGTTPLIIHITGIIPPQPLQRRLESTALPVLAPPRAFPRAGGGEAGPAGCSSDCSPLTPLCNGREEHGGGCAQRSGPRGAEDGATQAESGVTRSTCHNRPQIPVEKLTKSLRLQRDSSPPEKHALRLTSS